MTSEAKKQYYRDYYHRKNGQSDLSDFGKFYVSCLGLQIKQISTGKILSKGEYYEKVQQFFADFVLIPYAPSNGWKNSEEVKQHQKEVELIKENLKWQ